MALAGYGYIRSEYREQPDSAGLGPGGAESANAPPEGLPPPPSKAPSLALGFGIKTFRLSWDAVSGATFYRVLERDAMGTKTVLRDAVDGSSEATELAVAVHRQDWQASLVLEACNAGGCARSEAARVAPGMLPTIGYFKASNTGASDRFGYAVALSADGNTLAVGAPCEASSATGVGGNQADNSASFAGAVYVYARTGSDWSQQAYVKASNTGAGDWFGKAVALSADGNTLAVGAWREDSSATGVGGDQADNSASNAGAAYVYARSGTTWSQQAYIKASNTGADDAFGRAIALSADGDTLAVGAGEDSSATGVGGDQADNSASGAGAVYLF